ncbi:Glycosyltransferase involved in cell wall bisynthesis [Flavobacterium sp. 9R]|uniref:glycosyltransferase n=1 Tax=Flavobacterium sp. 9R TaxID=2653143 RepID=UPI0012F407D9|nr:glycosyltransferase [Flavobacterium sp. 9R]VXC16134.1 Glycosyltransferase involved in cell wall bisynthesis [Flavobacterium sp. 9R]
MELQKNKIAMVSPSQNAYSETFIQAQKKGLDGMVFYYYGGGLPTHLEQYGKLLRRKFFLVYKIKRKLGFTHFNADELAFIDSLKKNKIQVVLAQYGTTANCIVKICEYLRIPLITHFHGYDASVNSVIENCDNYKKVFDYSSSVIAVSISMSEKLIQLGCSKDKILYNTYGPDCSFANIVPEFIDSTFIALGRFVNKKAPYYTILAFKQVHSQFPDSRLIIGGTGELLEVCINLVRTLGLEDAVQLPGIMDRTQFVEYLSKGLAFVQHSVTAQNGDQEGTPLAVLEASAAGLPVVSTKHAGIPDVVIDGETGFIVQEHDVDTMAEKMILLLKNKELAVQLGKNGKERIKNEFSLHRHLNVIDDLIARIINTYE